MSRRKIVSRALRASRGHARTAEPTFLQASDPLYASVTALIEQAKQPLRRAILTRFLRAAGAAVGQATPATLTQAAGADSDLTAVLTTLEAAMPEPSSANDEDVITGAQLRGLAARQRVLEAEGGTLSAEQMACRLQLTRQAVDLRRRNHRLIGLPVGRHGYRYPTWQLGPSGVWSWVPAVLDALASHDPWQAVFFLLSPHPDLGGETPLHTLRDGRVDDILALARTYAAYGLG